MSGMELADGLRLAWGSRSGRMLTVARLGALAGVLWGVAHQVQRGASGAGLAVPLLAATASLGWLGWMACRRFEAPAAATWGCLAVLAVSGGALSGYAPFSVTFVAVGALGAGIAFDTAPAAAVGGLGVAAVAVSVLALGTASPGEIIAEGALAAVAGLMAGASRRQYLARAHQAEQLQAERVRADAERHMAAALATQRRQLHDVWPIPSAPSPSNSARPTHSWSRETTPNALGSWSGKPGASPSGAWRRRDKPSMSCGTSPSNSPSSWRRWPPTNAQS